MVPMSIPAENPVSEIHEDMCWNYLAKTEVGRLATSLEGRPEIFPLNYVVDGESLVFRSAEGSKLMEVTVNEHVAFEIDGWNDNDGWSVIVHGHAEVISDEAELRRAERLPLLPWVPTVKTNFVRVVADQVTGRRFQFGEEPSAPQLG